MPVGQSCGITVVIPVFGRGRLLQRAVASVTGQGGISHCEVIVVDDGSPEPIAPVGVLAHRSVRVIRQTNSGAGAARNLGANAADTEYLAFLDSDDELTPDWLSKMTAMLTDGILLASCAARVVEGRQVVGRSRPQPLGAVFSGLTANFLAGSYVVRRDVFIAAGGFDVDMPASQHTELAIRLAGEVVRRGAAAAAIDDELLVIHRHEGVSIRKNDEAVYRSVVRMVEKHRDVFERDPEDLAVTLATGGVRAIRSGHLGDGRRLLWDAVRVRPRPVNIARALLASVGPVARRYWRARGRQ